MIQSYNQEIKDVLNSLDTGKARAHDQMGAR